MRTLRVVVDPPGLDRVARLLQRREPVTVETLGAKVAIEGFGKGIVRRFPRPRELQLHSMLICPRVQRFRDELRSIVDGDAFWRPCRPLQLLQHRDDAFAGQGGANRNRRTYSADVIDYRQDPEAAA